MGITWDDDGVGGVGHGKQAPHARRIDASLFVCMCVGSRVCCGCRGWAESAPTNYYKLASLVLRS